MKRKFISDEQINNDERKVLIKKKVPMKNYYFLKLSKATKNNLMIAIA
jgi:hypothetical protein